MLGTDTFCAWIVVRKTDLINAYDDDKAMIADKLQRLERQQAILETDIDVALEIMRDVDRQWVLASPGARTRFQNILFPQEVDI